jgi:hypothetical protein
VKGRTRSLIAAAAWSLLLAACDSGSPTGPGKPGIQVSGAWAGEWRFVAAGVTVTDAITATLTQDGSTVSGVWTGTGSARGEWEFERSDPTTGTATIRQTALTGQDCTAVTTITGGSVSASTIELTLEDVPPAGICQWATSQRFVLSR